MTVTAAPVSSLKRVFRPLTPSPWLMCFVLRHLAFFNFDCFQNPLPPCNIKIILFRAQLQITQDGRSL